VELFSFRYLEGAYLARF